AKRAKPSVMPGHVKLTFTVDMPREQSERLSARPRGGHLAGVCPIGGQRVRSHHGRAATPRSDSKASDRISSPGLEHLDGLSRAAGTWDQIALRQEFTALLTEWQTLLQGEPVQARQILRKLIVRRLRMVPDVRPDGRFYQWSGQASYGRLLAGLIGV